jgi:hypothetical protein
VSLEFREPGEYASTGYTSGAPLQPEPYTELDPADDPLILLVPDLASGRYDVPHFER